MSTESLLTMLDVRKAAVRGALMGGVLEPLDLERFRPLLAGDEGTVAVKMAFSRDEESRYVIDVAIEADILAVCQRCLEPMPEHLSSESKLAVVWTDEEAVSLPRYLDPLILKEDSCNLWELVEDELILAMKPFNYHETGTCKRKTVSFFDPLIKEDVVEDKPNPFNVLEQLKPGNKH
jgi:uncharacterized protein